MSDTGNGSSTEDSLAARVNRFRDYVEFDLEDCVEYSNFLNQPSDLFTPEFATEQLLAKLGLIRRYHASIANMEERLFTDETLSGLRNRIAGSFQDARAALRALRPGVLADLVTGELRRTRDALENAFESPEYWEDEDAVYEHTVEAMGLVDRMWLLVMEFLSVEAAQDSTASPLGLLEGVVDLAGPLFRQPRMRNVVRDIGHAYACSQFLYPTFRFPDYSGRQTAEEALPWWFTADRLDREDFRRANEQLTSELRELVSQTAPNDSATWSEVERTLVTVDLWMRQEDGEGLFEALASAPLEPMTGMGHTNLIPSLHGGPCRPVLVVISGGPSQFRQRLRESHDHFIACSNTKLAIFVSDYWDEQYFQSERASTFRALNRRIVSVLRQGGRFGPPRHLV